MQSSELLMNMLDKAISLNIVIPIYNEVEVIPILVKRLQEVFNEEQRYCHNIRQVKFIFVDDGSKDNSAQLLYDLLQKYGNSIIVKLSRNFGHQAAVSAGLAFCNDSDTTVIIDADLQDPPEIIFEMLKKWREGFDVVYGQRVNRKENRLLIFFYWIFYRLYKYLTPIDVPMDSGDFCLMSQRVVCKINDLPEKLRFPRGLRTWVGFKQTGIEYDRPKRAAGKSKYNLKQLYRLATDGITSLSTRPLQLAQIFAQIYFLVSVVFLGLILFQLFFTEDTYLSTEFYLIVILTLMSNCIILFCMYILGAYIGRTYLEVKSRPNHIVDQVVDLQIKENG